MNPASRFLQEIDTNLLETLNASIKEEKVVDKKEIYNDSDVEFTKGEVVVHTIYGRGVVLDVDNRFVSIAFAKNYGIRKLLKNHKGIKKG